MKRKIILSFLLVLLISSLGALFAYVHVRNTNEMLSRLVNLHQIETLRQQLLRSIQTVQSDLYTVNTELGNKLDFIIENVATLNRPLKNALHVTTRPKSPSRSMEYRLLSEIIRSL